MGINGHIEPQIVLGLLLGEEPTKERKRDVARILAEKVNRLPFTTGYLDNIMAGRQECSQHGDMYRALMLMMEEIANSLIEYVDGGAEVP